MNFYVYYSYEPFGRGYIGCRKCKCELEKDAYLGSFKDKTFKPTEKVILETFDTYEEAIEAEIALHEFYDVAVNPHFANRAKQLTSRFTTAGTTLSEETRQKMRESQLKRDNTARIPGMTGKKHSEETKQKMSERTKLQVFTEETKHKMSKSAKLRVHTKEENLKIAETLRQKPSSPCPICGKMLKDQYLSRHIEKHRRDA